MERAVCAGAPQAVIMTDGADCTPVQNAPEWRIIHMYGAIIGDLVGFPYEYEHEDLTDRNIPLFPEKQAGYASGAKDGAAKEGKDYSDKTVLAAAVEAGLLQFERRIPEILAGKGNQAEREEKEVSGENGDKGKNRQDGSPVITVGGAKTQAPQIPQNAFEENYKKELSKAMRDFGQKHPLAGYPMDMSIWLFRGGEASAQAEDAGPAARVSPVAWTFQDDLYMMRHMARVQAGLTHRGTESVKAAEAVACAVFLAIHRCTKPYIAGCLEKEFGYRIPDEKEMREEILRAGGMRMFSGAAGLSADPAVSGQSNTGNEGGSSVPAMCVRAAMSAFLNGRDFEDVLRRAVAIGGNCADIAAIAGSIAEAFFGIPDEIREEAMSRLPADLRKAADDFAAREAQKKAVRSQNPQARARWEQALTRASSHHPAEVQGNELLEKAIGKMREKRDEQSFVEALEMVRVRINQKGRVFVPVTSAKRAEAAAVSNEAGVSGQTSSGEAMVYTMQVIRSTDGRIWQPAYTSRAELDKANAAQAKAAAASGDGARTGGTGMVLSYVMDALFKRFLPVKTDAAEETVPQQTGKNGDSGEQSRPSAGDLVPAHIQGIVLNPYGNPFFIPRGTIEVIFEINKKALQERKDPGTRN